MNRNSGRIFAIIDGGSSNIRVFLTREELILSKVCIQRGVIDRVIQRDENILFSSVKTALRETIRKLGSKGLKSEDVDFCIILGMLTSNIGLLDLEHLIVPVGITELARALVLKEIPQLLPCPCFFIRGVKNAVCAEREAHFLLQIDSMRGEETQTIGILDRLPDLPLPTLIVFLSSHTKYVWVGRQGKIMGTLTTMSGQIFRAIKKMTYLSRYIPDDNRIRLEKINQDDLWEGITAEREVGFLRAIHLPRFMDVVLNAQIDRCYSTLLGTLIGSDLRAFSFFRETISGKLKSIVFIGNSNRPVLYRDIFRKEIGQEIPMYTLDEDSLEQAVVHGSIRIFKCAEESNFL
jgi:2-dehydro-3-deoxygalactonokinase